MNGDPSQIPNPRSQIIGGPAMIDISNACRVCSEHTNANGKCTGAEYPCDCWTVDDPWGEYQENSLEVQTDDDFDDFDRRPLSPVVFFVFIASVAIAWSATRSTLTLETGTRDGVSLSLSKHAMAIGLPMPGSEIGRGAPDDAADGSAIRPHTVGGDIRTRVAGSPVRPVCFVSTSRFRVTAYCPCAKCCGKWSRHRTTASGRPVTHNGGKFAAADRAIPFGTMLSIPGYNGGRPVPVLDRGGAIRGKRLDVFFPTHAEARKWGVRQLRINIQ